MEMKQLCLGERCVGIRTVTDLTSESQEVVVEVRVGHDLSQIVEVADVILDVQINLLPTQDVGELLLHHTEIMTRHVAKVLHAEKVMSRIL